MFTAGFVLIFSLAFIMFKIKRRTALWLLGHDTMLDIGVTVLMTLIHWGTFTGLMAAAFAGLMCSAFTTAGRWAFGYISRGKYYPGKFTVKV
jgi:hypothetical protein